jgi:hypothetical protein
VVIVFCRLVMFWRKQKAGGLLYSRLSEMDTNKQSARLETTPEESAKTCRLAVGPVSVLMQEIPIRPAVMSQNKNKTGLSAVGGNLSVHAALDMLCPTNLWQQTTDIHTPQLAQIGCFLEVVIQNPL